MSETMFTKYYDVNGNQVAKGSKDAFFWIQTEIDCDLVHDTFNISYLWSVIQVLDTSGWRPIERTMGEFKNWERAQNFIAEILTKGRARGT